MHMSTFHLMYLKMFENIQVLLLDGLDPKVLKKNVLHHYHCITFSMLKIKSQA